MTRALLADPFSSAAAVFLVGFFLALGDVIGRWYCQTWAKVLTALRWRLYGGRRLGRRLVRAWKASRADSYAGHMVMSQERVDLGQILDDQVAREKKASS